MVKTDLTKTPEEVVALMGPAELEDTLEKAKKHDQAIQRRNRKAYQGSGRKRQIEVARFRLAKFKAAKERAAREKARRQEGGKHEST